MKPTDIEKYVGERADSEKLYVFTGAILNRWIDTLKRLVITTDGSVTIEDNGTAGTRLSVPPPTVTTYQPFQLLAEGGKLRILPSTIAGIEPTGFSPGDNPHFTFSVADGDIIYGKIVYSDTDGTVSAVSIQHGGTMPDNSTGTYYVRIGSVSVSGGIIPVNDRYGPINVQICRNYYAENAPYYGVNVS
jgi:hypothetical protein